ncbi:hypothetical protein K2Y11_24110 [bacterium]|nr:hypothetical protein [bacterium]
MVSASDVPIFTGITRSQSWLSPIDRAVEYLRLRIRRFLPVYLLAVLPQSMVVLVAIDAVASHHRSVFDVVALMLVGTTIWRWIGTAVVQHRIQSDIRGDSNRMWWKRLPVILSIRFIAAAGIVWGPLLMLNTWRSVFFVPLWGIPFFATFVVGLLLAGMITPLLGESNANAAMLLRQLRGDVMKSKRRVLVVVLVMIVSALWLVLVAVGLQYFLLNAVIANLLGLDTSDLQLTFQGKAWWLGLAYLIQLGFDLLWTVVSVMLFYDLQSRRLGSDLRYRLQFLNDRSQ